MYSAQELFGDFSDAEGFSDDENITNEGKKLFKKLSAEPCNINRNSFNNNGNKKIIKDTWKSKNSNIVKKNGENDSSNREAFSGINLINPLVSSDELNTLMQGRRMIKMSLLKSHINKKTNDIDDDWVTIGIVVNKTTKTSKNGNEYSLWKLGDLKTEKFVNLFLFGKTNEKNWKLPIGAVIGLLNATIMSDNKDYKGKAAEICSLTLDNPDKLLHIGTSKDMGYCKAQKKNGEVCGNIIGKSEDEFCLYHIKNAYRKFSSKRAELQSNFANKEPEDFYFGNNFTPNIALNQRNIVLEMKNVNKTQLIGKREVENKNLQKVISNPISLAARNIARISSGKSKSNPDAAQSSTLPITFKEFFGKMEMEKKPLVSASSEKDEIAKDKPILAKGIKRHQSIDFSTTESEMNAAKKRAIEIFKNKPIASSAKSCPAAATPVAKNKKLQAIMARVSQNLSQTNEELKREQANAKQNDQAEKEKMFIEKALNRKSINHSAVGVIESEAQEKYFYGLEKKERYEDRLAAVRETTVKVVTCAVCRYTAASQGELCKSKQHSVTFRQATKRFFACRTCKTRTFTFDTMMPSKACKQCGATTYDKCGMIKDKIETKLTDDLLIRGEEIAFLNSLK